MKCFLHNKKFNKQCTKKDCRYWINSKNNQNCCIVGSETKNLTLQDVGEMFNVTRMRICQIEKAAIKKVSDRLNKWINS